MLLNIAYATLSNLKAKDTYDAGLRKYRQNNSEYNGLPVSDWYGPPGEVKPVHSF